VSHFLLSIFSLINQKIVQSPNFLQCLANKSGKWGGSGGRLWRENNLRLVRYRLRSRARRYNDHFVAESKTGFIAQAAAEIFTALYLKDAYLHQSVAADWGGPSNIHRPFAACVRGLA
jgi:hypothetical protein